MPANCGAGGDSWKFLGCKKSILKEIKPEYSLEGLMLKLKLQLFGTWCKDPDAGKDWGQEEKRVTEAEMVGWQHDSTDISVNTLWEIRKDREAWSAAVLGVTTSSWTTTATVCLLHLHDTDVLLPSILTSIQIHVNVGHASRVSALCQAPANCCQVASVVSDSVPPYGQQPSGLWPRDSPGRNTGVGCHFLLHTNC